MKTKEQLKDYTLSQWIRLALADLLKCEKDKRYKIDMGEWHKPNSVCSVCFAGAVMAKTIGIAKTKLVEDIEDEAFPRVYAALDYIRTGNIRLSLEEFWIDPDNYDFEDIDVTQYRKDRLQWRKDMFKITRMLEEEGL